MKYLNEQRKEQRLVAATIQNEDFFRKIRKEFAWSFVKFLRAVKDFKIITTYSQKYGIVSFCPTNIAFTSVVT